MKKITLAGNLSLSRIIYGMWRLTDDQDVSAKHIQAKIEACLEQGISSFDQADIYGAYSSETLLGSALRQAPGLREQIEIITKCDIVAPIGIHSAKRVKYYDTSAAYITSSVERSLVEMSIEQIDLFLLHRPDPLMDASETGAILDSLIDCGKVKAVGVSNFRPWDTDLLQSRMKHKIVANQIEISLQENSALTNGDLAHLQTHSMVPMAWSPLAGRKLIDGIANPALTTMLNQMAEGFNVAPSSLAIAWLLKHSGNILPIVGSNNLQRIKLFSQALDIDLDRQSWFELYQVANGKEVA